MLPTRYYLDTLPPLQTVVIQVLIMNRVFKKKFYKPDWFYFLVLVILMTSYKNNEYLHNYRLRSFVFLVMYILNNTIFYI